MRRLNTDEWIEKARAVHGDKYDYSKVEYRTSKHKVTIVCRLHGDFRQEPTSHCSGSGCPVCGGTKKSSTEEWIEKARAVHGDKYDYSKVEYKKRHSEIIIICREHGEFLQLAGNHLKGHGCAKCAGGPGKGRLPLYNTEEWIEKARAVHGDKYDYSESQYKGNHHKIKIICPVHGSFEKLAIDHVSGGQGCQDCSKSGFKRNQMASLYVLASEGGEYMKVGISNNYKYRLRKLKRSTPFDFQLLRVLSGIGGKMEFIEKLTHSSFVNAGLSGFDGCTEWLKWDNRILEMLEATRED
jgi:hypothetical protein